MRFTCLIKSHARELANGTVSQRLAQSSGDFTCLSLSGDRDRTDARERVGQPVQG